MIWSGFRLLTGYPVFVRAVWNAEGMYTDMARSGKRHSKSHTLCRRCGNRSFHLQHKSTSCSLRHDRRTADPHTHRVRPVWLPRCQAPFVQLG